MIHIKNIMRSIIFLSILISSLIMINRVLVPKYIIKNSLWPTTTTYAQFYEMDKNSIDVIFLGSSVTVNAFIPQEIYNEYGIRSYNLGSEQQSIFLSYYWLKEALRFQNPKVVVLDLRFMRDYHPESPINTVESLTRKCLDPMKWSSVKSEAVHDLCKLDESQSELSYYLTNIRFHSRWSDIQEYDINKEPANTASLYGFAPIISKGPEEFIPYEQNDSSITMEFDSVMQYYLDCIVEICKNNNIQLMLVDLPDTDMDDAINNTHTEYAKEKGVSYYNLCSTEYYNKIGASLPEESAIAHANIWGAIKISSMVGLILKENYGITAVKDAQYEKTRDFYEQIKKSANLVRITDQGEYLEALDNPNYAVFMTAHGGSTVVLEQEYVMKGLYNLGLECKFQNMADCSYIAAIIGGEVVVEESSMSKINYVGSFRNRNSVFTLHSSGKSTGESSLITIEGGQYTMSIVGLNIAVYDLTTFKVIDRVAFQGDRLIR